MEVKKKRAPGAELIMVSAINLTRQEQKDFSMATERTNDEGARCF
jgi:hypothetical protein